MEKDKQYAKTIQFIETTMGEGAHLKIPDGFTEDRWNQTLDAALTYLLSPAEITLEKTGNIHNRTREWTRKARNLSTTILWNNSSYPTQLAFPYKELLLNKPKIPKAKEIVIVERKSLLDKIREAKTYEQKQKQISLVTRNMYQKNVSGENPFFLPVLKLVRQAGFHARKKEDHERFREVIEASKIAMGRITFKHNKKRKIYSYNFIDVSDITEAREALLKDEGLKHLFENPVSQVAGPKQEQLPSTTKLKDTKRYKTIYALLAELGINNIPMSQQHAKLLGDPNLFPAPVFCYESRYKFSIEDESALKNYALAKLRS